MFSAIQWSRSDQFAPGAQTVIQNLVCPSHVVSRCAFLNGSYVLISNLLQGARKTRASGCGMRHWARFTWHALQFERYPVHWITCIVCVVDSMILPNDWSVTRRPESQALCECLRRNHCRQNYLFIRSFPSPFYSPLSASPWLSTPLSLSFAFPSLFH